MGLIKGTKLEEEMEEQKPNSRFKNYSSAFKKLVKPHTVKAKFPLVSMAITLDSTRCITVTKNDDYEYWVKQYSLDTYQLEFEEKIGGDESQFIKCKEVEQSGDGSRFAVVYNDDGKFFLRTFGRTTRT